MIILHKIKQCPRNELNRGNYECKSVKSLKKQKSKVIILLGLGILGIRDKRFKSLHFLA